MEENTKEFRSLNQKEDNVLYKQPQKCFTVHCDQQFYSLLQQYMRTYEYQSMDEAANSILQAYFSQSNLVPAKELQLPLLQAINRIESNINQIVIKLHEKLRAIYISNEHSCLVESLTKIVVGYELVLQSVRELENVVRDYVSSPPPEIMKISWEEIKSDESKIKMVVIFLLKHLDTLQSDE